MKSRSMPPITYSLSDMPALCAAIGSFQLKSPTTYFVMVLMTAMAFLIRRVAPLPRCVYRHILCHQSAQHAVDPCRDTVARSQVLFRSRRSASTRFHSTCISPHASHPSRSRDRPQAHGHSHRGGSRHGMRCPSQPVAACELLPVIIAESAGYGHCIVR